jgi:hypothetical protein
VNATTVLLSVLIVVASALCGVAIWALVEAVKTARSVRTLTDDLDARMVPLIDKVDVSVDAFNAELLRVDAIVTRFEEISDRVESTSRTVQDVANAPVEIVTDIADRVRRAWRHRKSAHPEGYGPSSEWAEAEPDASDAEDVGPEPPVAEDVTPESPVAEYIEPEATAADETEPEAPDA